MTTGFIEDGYTLDGFVKELPGIYGAVRFKYRPLTVEQRVRLFENWATLPALDQISRTTGACQADRAVGHEGREGAAHPLHRAAKFPPTVAAASRAAVGHRVRDQRARQRSGRRHDRARGELRGEWNGKLISGALLVLTEPAVAHRDCKHCQEWLYEESGALALDRQGNPIRRPPGVSPPCRTPQGCPKERPNR